MRKTRFRGCSLFGRRQTRMDGVKVVMDMDLWDSVYNNDIVGRPFCPCRVSPTVGFVPSWVSQTRHNMKCLSGRKKEM
jgi:hypothetical protein